MYTIDSLYNIIIIYTYCVLLIVVTVIAAAAAAVIVTIELPWRRWHGSFVGDN